MCVSSSSPAKYPVPAEAVVKAPSSLCDFTLYFEIEDDLEKLPDHISVPRCLQLGIAERCTELDKGHRLPGTRHLFKRRKMKYEHLFFFPWVYNYIFLFIPIAFYLRIFQW